MALLRSTLRLVNRCILSNAGHRFSSPTIHSSLLPLQIIPKKYVSDRKGEGYPMPHILDKNELSEVEKKEIEAEVSEETKDWISYGFHYTDKYEDIARWNWAMFWTISVTICSLAFIFSYSPDPGLREWGRREAYLQLEKRERLGLPLVDPDLIPVDRVSLPSEEQLGKDYPILV